MARRVFLHVGTPKTGTSYLQSVLWANKPRMLRQGMLLPLEAVGMHYEAAIMVRGYKPSQARLSEEGRRAWTLMQGEIDAYDGDCVISHELFAPTRPKLAEQTISELQRISDEVHVVITARDLARQIPAEWQEETKHGSTLGLGEFYERLQAERPLDWFWRVQEFSRVAERWSQGITPSHLHVVTVPRPGGPPSTLLDRFTTVLGLDPSGFDLTVSRGNRSLGAAEVELLRRANVHLPADPEPGRLPSVWRNLVAERVLAARSGAQRFAPPPERHAWVVERGNGMVDAIAARGYDVCGDLDELRPDPQPAEGRNPDDVTDAEVLQVAVEALPDLVFEPTLTDGRQRAAAAEEETEEVRRELAKVHGDVQAARDLARAEINRSFASHVRMRAGRIKRGVLRKPLP